jgi:hypothetical protein
MRVKTISQDGDYGIFVGIEADDGELLNFYVCAGDERVICPDPVLDKSWGLNVSRLCTPEERLFALEASRQLCSSPTCL